MSSKNKIHNQREADRSIRRIKELLEEGLSQNEIVATLNNEGFRTIREQLWSIVNLKQVLFRLRHSQKSWYALSQKRAGLQVQVAA